MAEQKSKEQVKAEMDAAADVARDQLSELNQAAVLVVAQWVAANYMAAGYKRLGRILVAVSKAKAS